MLPINEFKWVREISQFNKSFIKIHNWNRNIRYFIEADIQYLRNWMICMITLLTKKNEDWKKITVILHDKKEYVIYIRKLKQALNHGLALEKA